LGYPTVIASRLHFPTASVPVGWTFEALASGMDIIGLPWNEGEILGLAAAVGDGNGPKKAPDLG